MSLSSFFAVHLKVSAEFKTFSVDYELRVAHSVFLNFKERAVGVVVSVLYHYFTSGYTGRHGTVVKWSAVRHIYVYGNSVVFSSNAILEL